MTSDKYPETIEFEIDRDKLRKYLRTRAFLFWNILTFFGAFGNFINAIEDCEYSSKYDSILYITKGTLLGLLIGFCSAVILYFIFSHKCAKKTSDNLQIIVEGAFLRVVNKGYINTDRKIHFRALVDYTIMDGRLMRHFGLSVLAITTTGGGQQVPIRIIGLKDCQSVRQTLAEIDAIREI